MHTRAHLAKDLATFDTLVIKIVEKDEKEELEQEYDFLSMLDHPNIIKPYLYASKGQITYEDDRKDLSAKAEDDAH